MGRVVENIVSKFLKNSVEVLKNPRVVKHLIGMGISIIGFWIIISNFGWMLALGIFLLMWANNIGQSK
jgi:hypothetical protein